MGKQIKPAITKRQTAAPQSGKTLMATQQPRFTRREETAHVDCGRVLRGDIAYTSAVAAKRPVLSSKPPDMSCEAIKKRVLPPIPMKEMKFGVAYARIVYRDYVLIEEELRSSYHPQNFFCYSIDKKADQDFHTKMKQLSSCIPNTFLTTEEYDVDSAGHYMDHAFYKCMFYLVKKPGWGYMLLLQVSSKFSSSAYWRALAFGLRFITFPKISADI
ncbi:unnamed protein product [Nippostrongylus brasiliensis]|uniref:Dynein light chain n=1 Tax=Nippostrongylus brasiliensis TaxID=27835 RepID=A0A0N4YJ38_NIPBR|nr:unnamed protein product [Nippostrongylus brasiliensis]